MINHYFHEMQAQAKARKKRFERSSTRKMEDGKLIYIIDDYDCWTAAFKKSLVQS